MRKKTRALSGASQEAYFRRVLRMHPGLSAEERDALLRKLRAEVAQVRVRVEPRAEGEVPDIIGKPAASRNAMPQEVPAVAPLPAPPTPSFDPYTPNVVVVLRKEGRQAALAALDVIDSIDNLRLLAREQRLSIGDEPVTAADVRAAIVTAAERRIANRMAAAS
jgi:hypothetical protein